MPAGSTVGARRTSVLHRRGSNLRSDRHCRSDRDSQLYRPITILQPLGARRFASEALRKLPDRDRLRRDGARELVAVHPYVIVYDVAPSRVTILRIWHGA
ncbi:MAG: type II toxin-antitoxin system RelE/ParE family toxin [Alphaproteobacteria bacterium]